LKIGIRIRRSNLTKIKPSQTTSAGTTAYELQQIQQGKHTRGKQ